jgi:hypothetical protein
MSARKKSASASSNWYFPAAKAHKSEKSDKKDHKLKSKSSKDQKAKDKAERDQSIYDLEKRARKGKSSTSSKDKHLKSFRYAAAKEAEEPEQEQEVKVAEKKHNSVKKEALKSISGASTGNSSNGNNLFEFLSGVNVSRLKERESKHKSKAKSRSQKSEPEEEIARESRKSSKSAKSSKAAKKWVKKENKDRRHKKKKCCESSSETTCEASTESSPCCPSPDSCCDSSSSSDDCCDDSSSTCSDSSDSCCENSCCPSSNNCTCLGDLTVGGRILTGPGTPQLPAYSFNFSPSSGVFLSGTNGLGFSSGGITTLTLDQTAATFTVPIVAPSITVPQAVIGLDVSSSLIVNPGPTTFTFQSILGNPVMSGFSNPPATPTTAPLVIPSKGLWELIYTVNWTPVAATLAGTVTVYILVNATQYAQSTQWYAVADSVQNTNHGSVVLTLLAGDTVSLIGTQTVTAVAGTITSAAGSSFEAVRLATLP